VIEQPKIPVLKGRFPAYSPRSAMRHRFHRSGEPDDGARRDAPNSESHGAGRRRGRIRRSVSGDGLSIAFNSALILGKHLQKF